MSISKKLLASFLFILLNLSPALCLPAGAATAEKDAVWVNQTFQKGKTFYERGDYKSAFHEWQSLDPYLDQYPSFQKVIGYLKSQVPKVLKWDKKISTHLLFSGCEARKPANQK